MDSLQSLAQYIKGVGPKKSQLLNKLGIKTINDLLFYFPRRHEDRSKFLPISELKSKIGFFSTIKGVVRSASVFRTRTGITMFQLTVSDGTGTVYATWFNQPYLKKYFKAGDNLILYGKVQLHSRLQMIVPEYEIITDDEDFAVHIGRITPIYPLTESVRQRMLRSIAYTAVENFSACVQDPVPNDVKLNQSLIDLKFAIKHIHFPDTFQTLENARRRLVFDEFFFLESMLALKKARLKYNTKAFSHKVESGLLNLFDKSLPFELTTAQKKVIEHIKKDMASPRPMCRLLQGDVGSGKTIVALHAVVISKQSGYQSAIMAPTEILAQQHYAVFNKFLSSLGVKICLLTSSLSLKEKANIKAQIKSGEVDVVVGTHSLIEEDVGFKNLSLVVVDEQHKFGVAQRLKITEKSINPDVLVMTATPIPRTLALTVYGDMDISVIDQMPPGRMPVKTCMFEEKHREDVYKFMRDEIKKGRQIFVVYPLIDEQSVSFELAEDVDASGQKVFRMPRKNLLNLKAASKMYEDFKTKVFPDLKVGLVHGRLKPEEKNKTLDDFRRGEVDILVSTIVIEVGIDMPNASVMIVEHAERFGLSQLHQLRGRIGRSTHQSYCLLVADAKTDSAKMRLAAMLETQNGFKIAERDLEIRGPGDFLGTRQSGLPEFQLANIVKDITILETARRAAYDVVAKDLQLSLPENRLLRSEILKRFGPVGSIGL